MGGITRLRAGLVHEMGHEIETAMKSARSVPPSRVVLVVAVAAWMLLGVAAPWMNVVDDSSTAVIVTVAVWGWTLWTSVAVAVLVPTPMSATLAHVVTPLAVLCAAFDLDPVGLFGSLVALIIVRSSVLVDHMVQGSAYGAEMRFALRTPWPQVVPAIVAWATLSATLIGGSIALADRSWWIGAPITIIGVVLLRTVPRRLHQLFRRWLVVVPAGVVIHDHLVLAETVMSPRSRIKSVAIVAAGGENADLTGGVPGDRLAIELHEPDKVVVSPLTAKLLGTNQVLHVATYDVAPRRPAAALRHIRI